jgi:hypothetical protein
MLKKILFKKYKALKTVMGYLQGNYRSRLYRMYIVNTPSSLMLTWGMLKAFLDENTVNKICFIKEGVHYSDLS